MDKYTFHSPRKAMPGVISLIGLFLALPIVAQEATDSIAVTTTTGMASTTENVADLVSQLVEQQHSLDTVWVILAAILVFWMQPGFALVEAGFTRVKNTANILMKNLLDFAIGSVLFWMIGFSFMFGTGSFIGMPDLFGMAGWSGTIPPDAFLMFQTVFCATSATIVSGAMAERTKFPCYIIYSILISLFIYPVSGHWTWGRGWLSEMGFHDFAGSTVVHLVGGAIAFVGAMILGPRIGKYRNGKTYAIPGHNLTLACLGVFILWMGWFGFNPGSQLAASGTANSTAISHVFLTTNLAAAAGGLSSMIVAWMRYKKPTLSLTLNGILAGLVGVTAGCDLVDAYGATLIGIICGTVMVFAVYFIDEKLKIDDPVGASSVHGVCGFLGTVLTGLFAVEGGTFYGGGFHFLGVQILGATVVGIWAFCMGYIVFKLVDKVFGLRVPARVEEEGLDIYEHGETAYN
ncbi:ammonium transporter [Parabacteroides pacaensis]|uniref:ammonium transporter n=1 Tax=Parabacteroides pacaensis TaxID=2086575 RepID=UPI000D0E522E